MTLPFSGNATPGIERHLFESFAADVVEELEWRIVIGHENVGEAVAVVIADGDAHAASEKLRETGLL